MALQGGVMGSQDSDVFLSAINTDHLAAAPEKELGQMADPASDIKDPLAIQGEVQGLQVGQSRLVKLQRRGRFKTLYPTLVRRCFGLNVSMFDGDGVRNTRQGSLLGCERVRAGPVRWSARDACRGQHGLGLRQHTMCPLP